MSWQSSLKSFITGTERNPLREDDAGSLGLVPSPDPAQTLLECIAAAHLARKAGFLLPEFRNASFPVSATDDRRICSEGAVEDLNTMLSGRYAEALPEFLTLLAQKNLRLPPESLPKLLEKSERDPVLAEKIRPASGARGEWLARQHLRWRLLFAGDEADWFTAAFADRKRLLAQTRARNPLLALAWLEKTWKEEKADHKAPFIEILHIRLSPADEDLLEKAFSDKSREVRLAAVQLLTRLPENRIFLRAKHFFMERLAGAFRQKSRTEAAAFLKKSLPEMTDEGLQPWLSLLSKDALTDWRNGLMRLFTSLLPPADLQEMTGLSRENLPEKFDDAKDVAAFLEAITRHEDDSWIDVVLRHFCRDFRHAIWQSREMTAFLTLFAPAAMVFFQKNNIVLGYDNQIVLRALEHFRYPWPKSMLGSLLEQYRRPAYGSGEIPGWHYASVLHQAAYHCHPPDAADSALVHDYLRQPPKVRPREFEEFLGIVRFRLNMQGHMQ